MNLKLLVALIGLVIIGVFALQNAQALTIRFLFWSFTLSQSLVIFFSGLVGLVIGFSLGAFSTRSRRS